MKAKQMDCSMNSPEVIRAWAVKTTDAKSPRWHDLLREKEKYITSFFEGVGKPATEVTAEDVQHWVAQLEQSFASRTVLMRLSHLRSFFAFLVQEALISQNPAGKVKYRVVQGQLASEAVKFNRAALSRLKALLQHKALTGDISAKRDYAILLFFLTTDIGRRAVLEMRWQDVEINIGGDFRVQYLYHGNLRTHDFQDDDVRQALLDYLKASGRLDTMQPHASLWTRHDRAGSGGRLSSQAFSGNLKAYCQEAGVPVVPLQTMRDVYRS